ncbi:sulfotransferase [bacterium]|nr:sulfotransferase [bacterium]
MDDAPVAMPTRVVAILTYTRAGSGLMASLLDSHPNILSTPDCLLMDFYEFWEEYGSESADQIIPAFMDHYAVIFDARAEIRSSRIPPGEGDYLNLTRLGESRSECLHVDQALFRRHLSQLLGASRVSRRLFFQGIHTAYTRALGRTVTRPLIQFSLHIPKPASVRKLLEDFPDTYFLQMVRHPLRGMASHFRLACRFNIHTEPRRALKIIHAAFQGGVPVPAEFRDRWRAVRLEDVHTRPRETLEKICEWLDLPWNDILLKSTVNGKLWWNEKNTVQVSGFSQAILSQKFEEYLPAFDRIRFQIIFARKCAAWNYPAPAWSRNFFVKMLLFPLALVVPFKMERICLMASLDAPPPRAFWKRMWSVFHALYLGRRFVFRAWIPSVRPSPEEVSLI